MLLTCDKYSLICLVETYLNLSDVSALFLIVKLLNSSYSIVKGTHYLD